MKKLFFIWFSSVALLTYGCSNEVNTEQENNIPTPTPSISEIRIADSDKIVNFQQDAEKRTISFFTSEPWTVSPINHRADEWCSISPTSGNAGFASIVIAVTANETPEDRSASIQIQSGTATVTIVVTQKQRNFLTLSNTKFEIEATGGTIQVELKSNNAIDYKISEDCRDWISHVDTRTITTSTLTFNIHKNTDTIQRQGSITFSNGEISEVLYVYQSGECPAIVISQDKYIVSNDEEQIKVEVSSNTHYTVQMPSVTWIKEDETRTMSTHTHYYTIVPNDTPEQRSAQIIYADKNSSLQQIVTITQMQKDALVLAEKESHFSSEGGILSIDIQHNIDFEVEIATDCQNWIIPRTTRAIETDCLTFDITSNTGYDNREGTITFRSKDGVIVQTHTVYQHQKDSLVLSSTDITLDNKQQVFSIEINTNIDFDVETSQAEWLHVLQTRALASHTLSFEVDENTTYDDRSAVISIINANNGIKETVNVVQAKKDAIYVSSKEISIPSNGEEVNIKMKANVDFNIKIQEGCEDWVKIMPETRALTESTIRIKVIENTELKDRDAMLYFYAGHQCSDTLTIHQASIDYIAFEKPAEVPYESGTISIEIQHSSNFKIDREEWYSANLSQTIDKWYLLTSEMVNPNLTKLTINYEENLPRLSYEDLFSVYPRKLALYMSAGSVNKLLILTQNVGPTFIINAEEIDVTAAAKIQNIIQADCPYELYIPTEARDWLSPYTENDMTQLSITANRSSSPREATITVSALDHKLSAEIKIKQAGAVVIPDPAFRKYLSEKGYIEIIEESDGICAIESSDITYFDIPSETASLKGIEYFQKLKNLDLSLNRNLTDADLSMLPLLELVRCNYCYNLTSLDLHNLTNLKKLSIEGNSYPKSLLKVLNIEGCCALEELDCCDNLLTYIDVSNKPMLQKVNCRNNDLRSLDFNNGPTTLSALNCDDNSMLSHINFGNIEYINGHGDYYDSSYISYAMSLSSSELTITGPRLQYLSVNSDNIKKLDLSKCPVLTRLSSMCSQITELDISQNYNLEYLRFYPSNTSFWDFSPYKSLKRLYIYSDINSIDISCCTELTHLSIRAHIADLNLQNNVKLKVLSLSNPGFAKLDLTNFMDLESLTLGYNAQLSSRIELNEVILGDKPMLQRVYCKGYDNIYERRTIKVLSLGKCPVLQELNCSYQLIENLNLENCPKLQTLECQYNQISSLDLTNKYDLISLNCEYNNIIELNTTQTWLGHSTGTPVKCLNNPLARIFVTTDANITGWMIPNTTEIIYQ